MQASSPLLVAATAAALATFGAAQGPLHTFAGAAGGDNLGAAVAGVGDLDGDGRSDVALGAPLDDTVGADGGAVILASGATGAVLRTLNGDAAGDQFGFAVSGAGDVNGDGRHDVIVGAPRNDTAAADAGRAVVYSGLDGTVLHVFDGSGANDWFGYAVGGGGDVNNDGFDDVIVGAPQKGPGVGAGYVRVFSGRDGSLLHGFAGDSMDDAFGWSVAHAGDVNGDCFADVIVGAPVDDNNGNGSGLARVYSGVDGSVLHAFVGDSPGDHLGFAVFRAGDVDGDGMSDVILGVPNDDNKAADAGSARVMSGADGSQLLSFDGLFAGDAFGTSVGGGHDYDGDGRSDVIVGSPWRDTPRTDAGFATVYSGADGTPLCSQRGENDADWFGVAVAFAGDVNRDGLGDLVIGASLVDVGANADAGTAYLFQAVPCEYSDAGTLAPAASNALFGRRMARLGDLNGDGVDDFVVGAMQESTLGRTRNGVVRVYSGSDRSVLFTFEGDDSQDELGSAVGDAGDVDNDGVSDIIVGAHGDRTNGANAGLVRLYSGATGAELRTHFGAALGDRLGSAVDGLGDVDNDGIDDYMAGAPEALTTRGTVVVYSGQSGTQLYSVDGTLNSEWLGVSVARIGDLNGDGVDDFVAGGPQLVPVAVGRGTVRVCSGVDGTTLYSRWGTRTGDAFGQSVAGLGGDIDGDGVNDFVVGAPWGNQNGAVAGFVRVFSGASGAVLFENRGAGPGDQLGGSVAAAGDIDSDGIVDYLAGAPRADTVVGVDAGAVAVISGRFGGPPLLNFGGANPGDLFGTSMLSLPDVNGDGRAEIAVGAPTADPNGPESGLVQFLHSVLPANPGFFESYGVGCVGSNGSLPRASGRGRPGIGQPVQMYLTSAPPTAPLILAFGAPRTALPLGGIGMPGCTLATQPMVSLPSFSDAIGKNVVPVGIPNNPGLIGGAVDIQWFAVDPPANPLGVIATNGLELVVGS